MQLTIKSVAMATMASLHWQLPAESPKSGIDLANLDTKIKPGTDFYQYATGGWQKAHPLTAEYSRYGSFDILQENNNANLRAIIDSVARLDNKQGSIEQKIASLYNSAMDSVRLNREGLKDMQTFLQYDANQMASDWPKIVGPVWNDRA